MDMVRRNEILDRELAQYAADWAGDLDDEAGKLARRMEVENDPAFRLDLVRLIAALREAGALLRGMPLGDAPLPNHGEEISEEVLRACARAFAFHLRNAASDAQRLVAVLQNAAIVLESNTDATLERHDQKHRLQSAEEQDILLPA